MDEIQAIQGLQTSTGRWVTISEFNTKDTEYDAVAWLDKIARFMRGGGTADLPCGGVVSLDRFDAFRMMSDL